MRIFLSILFLIVVTALAYPARAAEPVSVPSQSVSALPPQFDKRGFTTGHLAKLYQTNNGELFWHDNDSGTLTTRGSDTITQLETAWQDGLSPKQYGITILQAYRDKSEGFTSPRQADEFLSAAFLFYLSDLRYGRARNDENNPESFVIEPYHDSQKAFLANLQNPIAETFIATLRPKLPDYAIIRTALLNQQSQAVQDMAKRIKAIKTDGLLIHKGDKNPIIPVIREFLATEGFDVPTELSPAIKSDNAEETSMAEDEKPKAPADFDNLNDDMLIIVKTDEQQNGDITYEIPSSAVKEEKTATPVKTVIMPDNPEIYDARTERAFRNYQNQYGLLVDGIIGPKSVHHIQSSFENRSSKLAMTLERLRWYRDAEVTGKHILVNIPGFYTQTFDENGETSFFMDVIIGTGERRTPEMISVIPSITFAPYWMVPSKIARENVLPSIQKDPNYYNEMGFELFEHVRGERVLIDAAQFDWATITPNQFPPFRLRQRPGPHNSLGPVRVNIVNKHDIFLHGTSHPELFSLTNRNLSSGCVRLKDPWQMVQFIANKSTSFTENKLLIFYNKAVEGAEGFASYTIALDKKVPVHIVYWTSWVDERNIVHYANDIYNRDKTLERMVETQG